MANTNKYLSRINLGGQDYLLKDIELRQTVADLQAAGLEVVIRTEEEFKTLDPADYRGKLVLVQEAGGESGTYVEYVAVNTAPLEAEAVYAFERIGTTAADLTEYVKNTRKIAGLDLVDDIADSELKTALKLKNLAFKDTATATVAEKTVSGVKATGDISGTATITNTDTMAVVATEDVKGPAISLSKKAEATVASGVVAAKANEKGAVQFGGTISAPTLHIAANTKNVSEMFTAGDLPSWKAEPFTPAKVTKKEVKFAKEGMKASIGENSETLVLENVTTGYATDGFDFTGGAFDKSQLNVGTKPTISGTVATGMGACTADAPTFTGNKYDLSLASTVVTVTDAEYASGTIKGVKSVTYKKANEAATTEATAVSLNVGDITVPGQSATVQ